jgi:xylulokinase
MARKYFIGVDLGTTYLKVGVYNLKGELIAYSTKELKLLNPKRGEFFQDPNEFYKKTLRCIKKCTTEGSLKPKDIKGISFDGQSGGIMAIDHKFNPVIGYDIIIDERAQKYSRLLNETHKELIYKNTGCGSTYGEKIIYWNRNKEVYKKIHKFIQPADYVSGKMCGLKGDEAFMGFSYLCWSGLCDAKTLNWSKDICDKFDVAIKKLPMIVDTFKIIGYINKENAEKSGLKPGIPVIAGGGDGCVTMMGAGLNRPMKTGIIAGTANGIFHVVDKMHSDNKYKIFHQYSVFRNLKFLLNFDMSGRSHFWFKEMFYNNGDTERSLLKIEKKVSKIPQCSEKLMFFPNFTGTVWPYKPFIKGGWIGLDLAHKKEHLYKSILEAIAFNRYLDLIKIKEILNADENMINDLVFIGGGAKSKVWSQIIADVTGKRILKFKRNDFATLGSAFIAAKATSEISDIGDSIENILKIDNVFYPDANRHKKYIEFMEIYKAAVESLEQITLRLNNFNLN